MKKFCALVCLFTLLLAAPAFAAKTGFDIHKGAFGPKIKGLQLGMPMTLRQLKQTMRDTFSFSEFGILIWGINGLSSGDYLLLRYREDKDGHLHYKLDDEGAYRSFEQYDSDGDIFDEIEKIGYEIAHIYNSHSVLVNDISIDTRHNRVSDFELNSSVFGAGSMSFEEFTQTLRNAYLLPPLEETLLGNYYGYNHSEGWKILILLSNGIKIDLMNIPDND